MMWGRDMGRRRYERTLDWVMGVGEYSPIPTIPVEVFDVGPSALTAAVCGATVDPIGRTLDLGVAKLGLPVEEVVELRQLQLDGGQGGVHLRLPLREALVERSGRRLERSDVLLPLALS
jgi:hypothetical protein